MADLTVGLGDLATIGGAYVRGQTLARNAKGGTVSIHVAAVHVHSCPYWRQGRRHGPCNCGALEEWRKIYG